MGIFDFALLKTPRIPSIGIRQTQPNPPRPVMLVGSAGFEGFRFATSKAEVGAATASSSSSGSNNKGCVVAQRGSVNIRVGTAP